MDVAISIGLIVLGSISAFVGLKVFKALLPVIGFVSGLMIGFGGTQAVFGTGVLSTSVAVVIALIVGIMVGLLSFMFFEIAVVVLSAMVGSVVLTYLGTALGLGDAGFIMLMLGVAGAIMGLVAASSGTLSVSFVIALTSALGVGYIFGGVMMLVGQITLADLEQQGIIQNVVETVDQSFIWLFAWVGGTLFAMSAQKAVSDKDFMNDAYSFTEK